MKVWASVLACLLLAAPAFAQALDGKWSGAVQTDNGEFPVGFTFKAEGDVLTGTMTGLDGAEFKIDNGKIEGANISFSVTLDFNGNAFTLNYTGVVGEEEIKLAADANGQILEFVIRRAG